VILEVVALALLGELVRVSNLSECLVLHHALHGMLHMSKANTLQSDLVGLFNVLANSRKRGTCSVLVALDGLGNHFCVLGKLVGGRRLLLGGTRSFGCRLLGRCFSGRLLGNRGTSHVE